MPKVLLATFAIALIGFAPRAEAEVTVADTVRYELINYAGTIQPGAQVTWEWTFNRKDLLEINVELYPDAVPGFGVLICPKHEYEKYVQGLTAQHCGGLQRAEMGVDFYYDVPFSGEYILLVDNSHSVFSSKAITANLVVNETTTDQFRTSMSEIFGAFLSGFEEAFIYDHFNVYIEPCGEKNAFSYTHNGDIKFCTELIHQLTTQDSYGALVGIFLHEMGHSLLNLWGLPNYQNEDAVDEFSTVLLIMMEQKELANQYHAYFAQHDSVAQATYALYYDSPHSLSIQRMRNIEKIIDQPDDYIWRWRKVLYENATAKTLQSAIDAPDKHDSPELARTILQQRQFANKQLSAN